MNFKHGIGEKMGAGKCLPPIFLLPFSCQLIAVGLTVMGLLGSGLDGYGQDTGLAPEVTDLNAEDVSYQLEHQLPYLEKPYISARPEDRNDGGFGCPRLVRGSLTFAAIHTRQSRTAHPLSPAAKPPGKAGEALKPLSEDRNDPPDKPGAFVTSQSECRSP